KIGSTTAESCPYWKLFHLDRPILRKGMDTATPSGKFCKPIPMANRTAPVMLASGTPEAAPPNKTPTAKPSGILCKAIAMVNKVVRCKEDFGPSDFKKLR